MFVCTLYYYIYRLIDGLKENRDKVKKGRKRKAPPDRNIER